MRVKKERKVKSERDETVDFLHSGGTLFNLAASQLGSCGGIPRGRVTNFVGDGSSGKTIRALEVCAHGLSKLRSSKLFPKTEKMKVIYNNPEGVMDFNLDIMYGKDFKNKVDWRHIQEIEAWGYDFAKETAALKKNEGLIYVIDSLDALMSADDGVKFEKDVKKGTFDKSGYNLDKQKFMQKFFRGIIPKMTGVDTTLIIVSQTREKIGSMFGEKTRAGGAALNFYTHLVPWLNESKKIKKTVSGQDGILGIKSRTRIKRSKVAKPFRDCTETILFDYGIDDITSMIEYHMSKDKDGTDVEVETAKFICGDRPEFKSVKNGKEEELKKISKKALVKIIEKNNFYESLVKKTEEKWWDFERKISPNRKPRF